MSMSHLFRALVLVLAASLLTACGKEPEQSAGTPVPAAKSAANDTAVPGPPIARVETVEDVYHGTTVADPYRWLENWDDPAVRDWSEKQNAYTRRMLAAMPERPVVHNRIMEILKSAQSVTYNSLRLAGKSTLLAMKSDPEKQHALLVIMGADGDPSSEKALVDPNVIDQSGATSIDWYAPSWDGKLVAVSLSAAGSESGDVHVYKMPSGEETDVIIERVNGGTAGGDLAWFPDNSGFYYTRYPRAGERPEADLAFYLQVWQHKLGTPAADDSYVIGEDFSRIAEIRLITDPDSGRLLVWVQEGDSNRFQLNLRQKNGSWDRFSDFGDGAIQAVFGPDNSLYVISLEGAPRGKILKLDAAAPDLAKADVVVPETDGALSHSFYYIFSPGIVVTRDRIYAIYQTGGPDELRVFSLDGKPLPAPAQMDVSTVYGVTPAGGSDVYFGNSSYVAMPQWFRFNAADGANTKLAISSVSPVDYSDVEVVREFATSKDGTRVPVNILMPKGTVPDGTRGILVTGYGGYGVNITPSISMSRHILFENGMLFAQANLRGGGEFGESWHLQGSLTNKQNVFDDFAAVIRHLVERGYAAADRVAIMGGSNGGLLMGATIVQHPELIAAVVSHVGIYDSVRSEFEPNGEFNIPEFGTVKDPDQFKALFAYSPYHNVKDGTAYPPILMPTGANDPRVNPLHSRKFTARLQAAQKGNGTVLLRTSSETGHGGGTPLDEVIELLTDQYAFVFHYLHVPVAAQ